MHLNRVIPLIRLNPLTREIRIIPLTPNLSNSQNSSSSCNPSSASHFPKRRTPKWGMVPNLRKKHFALGGGRRRIYAGGTVRRGI